MRNVVVVGVLGMMAGSALAQPGTTPAVPPQAAPAVTAPTAPGEISETSVARSAVGATLASWAVLAVGATTQNGGLAVLGGLGTLVAPSIGNLRAGGNSLPWIGLRLVGVGAMVYGLVQGVQEDCDDCGSGAAAGYAALGGLGLYIAASVADIATAPAAARAHNRALAVAPMVHPGGGGVMLGGSF